MYVLFEEGGKFLAARVLSQAESSLQAEMDSGKRVKLKSAQVLLQFEQPAPAALLQQAADLAATMDVNLAWEFASEEEFGFAELAAEYFSAKPSTVESAASLMCLFNAPHYFRRAGKGRFKKASAEIVQQALAAIEKKKQIVAQISAWAQDLAAKQCPEPIRQQLYKILFKPDKNAPEYKAVVEASRNTQTAPLALLMNAGAIGSAYEFHWQRFAFEHFPKGTQFPDLKAPAITDELPLAHVQAFSIDDSQTTEIDDALSVQGLGSGVITLGVHIAAPALAVQPGSALDKVARDRYSTVYMPGHKITMLPDSVVQHYTLAEGQDCPALSLYVQIDEASLEIKSSETRLERVHIAHNLRHDQLDSLVSEDWLLGKDTSAENLSENGHSPAYTLREQLSFLYRLATHLKAQREQVRGKPETFNRPDYNFRVAVQGDAPQGDEPVDISVRRRGAPLDLMVAECMILANSTWGLWLAQFSVPGIYRSQASLAPGVKVRMGTKALPHAGIGVKAYAWSTSPLRRYTDLVNQWQLIACVRNGTTAALVAPFKPKDAELFGIVSGFDAAYTAYNAFQNGMERYWTMRYVQQRGITELTATVMKDGLVRAEDIPLVMHVASAASLPRGARVKVRMGEMDLLMLEVSASFIERLDVAVAELAGDEEDDEPSVGVHLAMDVNEDNSEKAPDSPA
ncbi:RNB domain-containing ribonuclease [Variovorax sp. PCZ-1]|uniref:ribonuclease catalytic domain-containing protein n=1 Tax=Variovorax sp. PCZ-1 TaxID=2835533 RepID=UPI001BCAAB45|nr:RNB domain-containing ribonuclease [Variovorax sp. PCZ-1]MBS7808160.1 RNB domain-containing ribonuclease [Variovorax sp. PCZ-1]